MENRTRKFTATAPDGTQITRISKNHYTHAVICAKSDGKWGYLGFSGSRQLAEKVASQFTGKNYAGIFEKVLVVEAVESEATTTKYIGIAPDGSKIKHTSKDDNIKLAVIVQGRDGKWGHSYFTNDADDAEEKNQLYTSMSEKPNSQLCKVAVIEMKAA